MERQFQNDKFWYFISNGNDNQQTRIDVLFDLLQQKSCSYNTDRDHFSRLFRTMTIGSDKNDDTSQLMGCERLNKEYKPKCGEYVMRLPHGRK